MDKPIRGHVILRRANKDERTGVFTVPAALGVDHFIGREFAISLTEDGILFTLVPKHPSPRWVDDDQG